MKNKADKFIEYNRIYHTRIYFQEDCVEAEKMTQQSAQVILYCQIVVTVMFYSSAELLMIDKTKGQRMQYETGTIPPGDLTVIAQN